LYLNGAKVGDHVLSPAMTQYPKRVFYVTHDVTDMIRAGKNAIGVVLGNGRYYSPRSQVYAGMPHYGFPKLLLHLRLEYQDGATATVVSDESWRLTDDGPIRANNEYDGEEYDARKELAGWSEVGYDDAAWKRAAVVDAPEGVVAAQMIEPIRVTETLQPIAVTEPLPDVFIFDMGQNMVGWCRLKVTGPASATITLRHAETLNPDGTLYMANIRGARVTDKYTIKGGGPETWEPRFTYHGFRYAEVKGWPGELRPGDVRAVVLHTDMRRTGWFSCSEPLLNRLHENVVRSMRGNFLDIPTDCPQRDERLGWTGDVQIFAPTATFLYDCAGVLRSWLKDLAAQQHPDGRVPMYVPHIPTRFPELRAAAWGDAAVIVPWTLYERYGDLGVPPTSTPP
jgi:alpha-L-rhamnosidase